MIRFPPQKNVINIISDLGSSIFYVFKFVSQKIYLSQPPTHKKLNVLLP